MAAIQKVDREDIIKGAYHILREKGIGALNARSLAKELNCSTKPIYFQFANMNELKQELKRLAELRYMEFAQSTKQAYATEYLSHGMAYIRFAKEEKHLFSYLYLHGRRENRKMIVDDVMYDNIIVAMMKRYSMDENTAKNFHFDMAIYSYGLAVMINTGFSSMTDEEVEKRLTVEARALYAVYMEKGE